MTWCIIGMVGVCSKKAWNFLKRERESIKAWMSTKYFLVYLVYWHKLTKQNTDTLLGLSRLA